MQQLGPLFANEFEGGGVPRYGRKHIQNDVYHLFAYDGYTNIAYIGSRKSSAHMNKLFRNIRENTNVDYGEESEDVYITVQVLTIVLDSILMTYHLDLPYLLNYAICTCKCTCAYLHAWSIINCRSIFYSIESFIMCMTSNIIQVHEYI